MGLLDRLFGPSEDGLIKLSPEVLDRALSLLGSNRQVLAGLASKEAAARRVSAAEADKNARETEQAATRQYEQEYSRIRRERDIKLSEARSLTSSSQVYSNEAYLHGEVARLMGPAKAK